MDLSIFNLHFSSLVRNYFSCQFSESQSFLCCLCAFQHLRLYDSHWTCIIFRTTVNYHDILDAYTQMWILVLKAFNFFGGLKQDKFIFHSSKGEKWKKKSVSKGKARCQLNQLSGTLRVESVLVFFTSRGHLYSLAPGCIIQKAFLVWIHSKAYANLNLFTLN